MKDTIARLRLPSAALIALGLLQIGTPQRGPAADADARSSGGRDLSELDLERLMEIKVISVSKRLESWFTSPAAIDVITADDIRRSGANHIPDALRGSPGLAVARMDSHTWAISPRGFNNELASKTLVLMDGRSVYTPLNAGVYWDAQDTVLADIDRIEIIRGPGGALWGANAVNGVINILTKSAKDTQGLLAEGGGGTLERVFGTVRYGGQIGDHAWYRVYGKYAERGEFDLPNGAGANDDWRKGQAGFRIDWEPSSANTLTFQGDYYEGREHQTRTNAIPTPPFFLAGNTLDSFSGVNVLSRWTHRFENDSEFRVQAYYDHTRRANLIPEEVRDTADLDAQYRIRLGKWQEVIVGAGYRWTGDSMKTNFGLFFADPTRDFDVINAFVQDEVTLVRDRLRLTLGSKFEHNDFTGFEIQPSARLAWTPGERHTVWGAVSRAVRTPSRSEDDVFVVRPPVEIAPGVPAYLGTFGNHTLGSETLIAYELGWRAKLCRNFSFDLAAFYNDYDELRTVEAGPTPFMLPLPLVPLYSAGSLTGESYGAEAAINVQATDWWRLRGSYTFLRLYLHTPGSGTFPTEQLFEDNEAVHRASLRSQMDLPGNVQFDVGVHYVDELRTPGIGSYVVMDVRLAWRPCKNAEISIVGTDLLDRRHAEFAPISNPAPLAEVPRAVYGKLTLKF